MYSPCLLFVLLRNRRGKPRKVAKIMRDYNGNFVAKMFGEQKRRYLGYYGGSMRTNKEKDARSEREK
jgi:hypothetical protein